MSQAARNVALAIISALVLLGPVYYGIRMVRTGGAYPDFSVFWTAAQVALEDPARLYDHWYLTQRQAWLAPPSDGLRPWVNPPSALLLFVPFALLPFWPAFWLWVAISLVAFCAASRLLVKGWPLVLAILSPAVAMAATWGQMSLLLGAVIITAVVGIKARPAASGALLGAAAAIKPQLLLLAPIALASGRHWSSLAAFVAAGAAMVAASLLFGFQPWLEWSRALGGFVEIVQSKNLYDNVITPAGLVSGAGSAAFFVASSLGVLAGFGLAWWSFTRAEPEIRLAGLVCGSLLCSPYAMRYELAILAPVAAAVLFSAGRFRWFAAVTLISVPGVLALLAMPASLIGFRRENEQAA